MLLVSLLSATLSVRNNFRRKKKYMMKLVIAVLLIIASIKAERDAYTLEHFQNVDPDGSYNYVYRTSNGITAEESGIGGQIARGSFDYISKDGQHVELTYEADEFGYRPKSDLLPQSPPIPPYILRALEYIKNSQQTQNAIKK